MRIEDLYEYGVPKDFIKNFKKEKIETLYPPQSDAIKNGVLDGESLVLSVPTAAGKTLIASLAAIKKLSSKPSKVIYIVPLVALANEKYAYYKKLFDGKWKVAISVGNLDSVDKWLSDYDFIVCTTEKLDSLIRHSALWIREIDLVVIDEIHLLNDVSRGPTLEILITRLKEIVPDAQFLSLSATIKNSDEVAEWMDSTNIVSDFRPVKLYEGVSCNRRIKFFEKEGYEIKDVGQEEAILENTLNMGKQALFFVSTRRNAEGLARKLMSITKRKRTNSEKKRLSKLADKVLNSLEIPTRQCKKLAECVRLGSAFHHAGLLREQKTSIEDAFRDGLIKSVSATPTLAMGVNLPAFRVIIRDPKRYYRGFGLAYIPVLEYKQFIGRAGRPQYDEFGESILVARSENDADKLVDRFIMGEPEDIKSKLAVEPVLRIHALALIASGFTNTEEGLLKFFSKTFYAFQYGDIYAIEDKLLQILENLESWGFIKIADEKIRATRIGRRVSELYLDPLTAHVFIKALKKLKKKKRAAPFGLLQLISNTIEAAPPLSIRRGEFSEIDELMATRSRMFLQNVPREWDMGFERFMKSVKTAMFFEAWIEEKTEDQILNRFKVAPGELRGRLYVADWLTYSLQELALLLGIKKKLKDIRKLRVRLKYGVREELIPLVRLKSIGRVRARKLYNAKLKKISSLKKVPLETLSKIVGPGIAYKIKEQVDKDFDRKKTKYKKPKTNKMKQSNLEKF